MPSVELEYITARCKFFNDEKGFGFIELPGGGLDIFVHVKELRRCGIDRNLEVGERVKFRTSKGPKGCIAVDISLLG